MQIKSLSEKEVAFAEELWDYCFEKKTDPFFAWYFSRYCQAKNILGAFTQGKFAGMAHLNPYTLLLNGQTVPASYLVGVAVAPAFRRQGVLRKLLAASFTELTMRGQPLAVLQPVAAGLYNKHGFAYCYYRLHYRLPLGELANLPRPALRYDFPTAAVADWSYLQTIYKDFSACYNGKTNRDKKQWLAILGELSESGGHAVLGCTGSQAQGYLLYTLKNDCFQVIEMAYINNAAKFALLSFAAQHSAQCYEFTWLAPVDDLTFLEFKRGDYYPVYKPFMMGRIIDPAKTLALLKLPAPSEDVYLELTDSIITENNAVFSLSGAHGPAQLLYTGHAPQIRLEIGAFAQLCFGAHSVDSLCAAGRLEIVDQAALDALRTVFPRRLNYINEYF